MNYKAKWYAQSFFDAATKAKSAKEVDTCIGNLVKLVEKNRDQKKLKEIMLLTERLLAKQGNVRKVMVETAKPLQRESKKLVESLLKQGDYVEEKIDPSMIAGIRVTINDELQFDGSLERKMKKMFGV